jgi:AraC-like DNA-binding protein
MAGMSFTSFHRRFLGVISLSLLRFQKQSRLQEAPSRHLSSSQDVVAAAAGFAVVYDSPSQFSASIGGCLAHPQARTGSVCARLCGFPPFQT